MTPHLFNPFWLNKLYKNQLLLLLDSFYVLYHVCDDLILFHHHICHVRTFLSQAPGNVGADQHTQVFFRHLIVLTVLADIFHVRQKVEKGLPGKIFNKWLTVTLYFYCSDLLGSSSFDKIRFIFFVAVLAAFSLSKVVKNGSSSFISVSSFIMFQGRSGLDNSLQSCDTQLSPSDYPRWVN